MEGKEYYEEGGCGRVVYLFEPTLPYPPTHIPMNSFLYLFAPFLHLFAPLKITLPL